MSNPIKEAEELVAKFAAKDKREKLVVEALRKLLSSQTFDEHSQRVDGPRISISEVARNAKLSRNLLNQDDCELVSARGLVVSVLELLSTHNLEAKCEYLTLENRKLQKLVDFHVSETAGLILRLGGKNGLITPIEGARKPSVASAKALKMAAEIISMSDASVAKKQRD